MIEKHCYTSEEKLEWWGYGEWVEEPDEIKFEHLGFECHVLRIAVKEFCITGVHVFGGYLNGYVKIPSDHPYNQKEYEDMHIDCHCGLTFGECSDEHWIGFDCAHSGDLIPSRQILINKLPELIEIQKYFENLRKKFNSSIFQENYKNIQFCIGECKLIAEQLNSLKKL